MPSTRLIRVEAISPRREGFPPSARITDQMTTPPDPALRALLRRADLSPGLPPLPPDAFVASVHARIRAADTAPLRAASRLGGLGRQLFPLAAAFAVIASLGAGSAVAYARERDARAETFAAAYARSIDPWQMHAAEASADPGQAAPHRHP